MNYRSIYVYQWDIASGKHPSHFADFYRWVEDNHLNSITMATSYHAGKFIRPAPSFGPRVVFPEDGTVYFRTDERRYGRLKPKMAQSLESMDVLAKLCTNSDTRSNAQPLDVYGWTVLLHNSRLGFAHPDVTVCNAFGDPYPYSLCPSHPDAREYAVNLCADISTNYEIKGLNLETPGFLPFTHGYHHEFSQTKSNDWLEQMLGICFCHHCLNRAEVANIDGKALKTYVAHEIDTYIRGDVDLKEDDAASRLCDEIAQGTILARYIEVRCQTVTSLVQEIRDLVSSDQEVFVIPSVQQPSNKCWMEGSDLNALAKVADGLEIPFYNSEVACICDDYDYVRKTVGSTARIRGILRPGNPDIDNLESVQNAENFLLNSGAEGTAFYNYGLLRPHHRDNIGRAKTFCN